MAKEKCSIVNCTMTAMCAGMCFPHYRWTKSNPNGSPESFNPKVKPDCAIENCERTSYSKGFCKAHYERSKSETSKKPLSSPIREGGNEWYKNKNGYLQKSILLENGKWKTILQHRTVMEDNLGRSLLPGENVHHINGQRDDNRIENLELWSTSQPYGQRVADKVAWAIEMLKLYKPESLA